MLHEHKVELDFSEPVYPVRFRTHSRSFGMVSVPTSSSRKVLFQTGGSELHRELVVVLNLLKEGAPALTGGDPEQINRIREDFTRSSLHMNRSGDVNL